MRNTHNDSAKMLRSKFVYLFTRTSNYKNSQFGKRRKKEKKFENWQHEQVLIYALFVWKYTGKYTVIDLLKMFGSQKVLSVLCTTVRGIMPQWCQNKNWIFITKWWEYTIDCFTIWYYERTSERYCLREQQHQSRMSCTVNVKLSFFTIFDSELNDVCFWKNNILYKKN